MWQVIVGRIICGIGGAGIAVIVSILIVGSSFTSIHAIFILS
jgi:hypothetical protein